MPSLPKTYRAVVQRKKDEPYSIEDVELKLPEEGQILVKVLASGVCHSDSIVKHEIMPVLPRVPGHEICGDVVAVPDGEKDFKVGDRVGGGWHGGHCFMCSSCRSGDFVTCQNQAINGTTMDGGHAEYVLLRREAIVNIPTDIDPAEAAPLLCAGVTVFNSMRNQNAGPGDLVAIQGIGGLGHLAIQFASKLGFRVAALSSSDKKKDLAHKLGAQEYVDGSKGPQDKALSDLGGAKMIVCTAPSPDVVKELVNGLAVDGTLLVLAPVNELSIPMMPVIQKRLRVQGWPSGTAKHSEECILFSQHQGIKTMIEKFPLERADEAYENMTSGKTRFRAVLIPGLKNA
ncbi:Alcohol dehydrogenase, class V [Phaffia rhodozyma]|uniref:Alcohol dehydrogenase, class V n=1 Tax=Phaffia rhodozyma TaxID=264483 RepID=A0A0F7SH75_PHARH|nr:Alcohol dehydrogenase, class V [Phaffia rhodozyma]